ncbi:hypothetical protein [Pseudomonas fluorescens]|uniref:hypothetical protein n=1 Tax=Pseudomonas fluorescens TaxID=294 RepID=UPI001CA60833|nr:hypothetical protein [Pseudomonas fluorescens]MBY8934394.1 hypothetical protein [Pseudomonas fluorescens]
MNTTDAHSTPKAYARLDPSFGNAGRAIISMPGGLPGGGADLAIDHEGNIVFAASSEGSYIVGRLKDNGALDQSFGTGGLISGKFAVEGSSSAYGITIEKQTGSILLAGGYSSEIQPFSLAFALFDSSGQYKADFGEKGQIIIPQPVEGLALDQKSMSISGISKRPIIIPDGRILYVLDGYITRLSSNGTLDKDFNHGKGFIKVSHPEYGPVAAHCLLQSEPGLILVGGSTDVNGKQTGLIARYLDTGELDTRYGRNGFFLLTELDKPSYISTILMKDQNKLLGLGAAGNSSIPPIKGLLICIDEHGNFDPSFSNGCPVLTPPDEPREFLWYAATTDNEGRILATGDSMEYSERYIPLGQFLVNGAPDLDFGERMGWIRVEPAGRGEAVKVDQKGRVVVMCSSSSDIGGKLPMVIRYLR